MAEFDGWAEYYDIIHDGLPGDVEFYLDHAQRAGGEVLEVGVGTGRIAIPMAIAGLHATGVDDSAAMLALCVEKLRLAGRISGSLQLVKADMAALALRKHFALVTMPYRTFMHLMTPAAQRRALLAIRRHMTTTGLFIFNTWAASPSKLRTIAPLDRPAVHKRAGYYEISESDGTVIHYCSTRRDDARHWLVEEHVIHELDARNRITREVILPLVRRWTTRDEAQALIEACGFDVQCLLGGFDGRPFTARSTEMIWVLSKRP